MVEAKGKRVRGRLYPWGIVEGKPDLLTSQVFEECLIYIVETDPHVVVCSGELGAL